jgi:hypothetical protein
MLLLLFFLNITFIMKNCIFRNISKTKYVRFKRVGTL